MQFQKILTDTQMKMAFRDHTSYWGRGMDPEQRYQLKGKYLVDNFGYDHFSMTGLLDEKGTVLSSLKKYRLTLHWNGCEIPTLGIGAVFTNPDYRRQGLAAKLIAQVLEGMAEENYQAALLFSDIGIDYYRRLGFEPLECWDFSLSVASLPEGTVRLRKAVSSDQFQMKRWYTESIEPSAPFLSRGGVAWELYRHLNLGFEEYILNDSGYVIVRKTPEDLLLEEAAGNFTDSQLLLALKTLAKDFQRREIRGWRAHPKVQALGKPVERTSAIPMVAGMTGIVGLQYTYLDHF